MHFRFFIYVVLSVGVSDVSSAQEREFDVEAGVVDAIYFRDFDQNSEVECKVRVSDSRYIGEWGPSFGIILSETGEVLVASKAEEFVQIVFSMAEKNGSRLYAIRAKRESSIETTPFLDLADDVDNVTIRLGWRDDGLFEYFATEGGAEFGQGQVSVDGIEPKFAVVVASGMKGHVACGAR